MIDYFAIGLTHGLLALAAWRLLSREDLDSERGDPAASRPRPWLKRRRAAGEGAGDA